MLNSQKLQVEALEAKSRINALRIKESLTDGETAELETLQKRDSAIPGELRAAIVSETAEAEEKRHEFEAGANGDGQPAEVRALLGTVHELGKATLSGYLAHASAGSALDGAEAELSAALEVRATGGGIAVPWALLDHPALRDRRTELRADTATTTAALGGPERQRPILQRLFGRDVMAALGVRIDSVPSGVSEWPLLTGAAAPLQKAEDAASGDAAAATFDTHTLKPRRLTGRYVFTVEQRAQIADIEQALRRDLGDAVRAKMSDQAINGNGVAPHVSGFLKRIAAPDNTTAESAYADYAGVHAQAVDGIHAVSEREVSSVVGVASYRHAASVYDAGSGEAGSEALMRRSAGCRASSFIPAASNAHVQSGNILHAGTDAMRGDSIAAMWPTLEVIRDIYTRAGQGGVVLTWITLWDLYAAFRSAAYARVAFQVG